MKVAFFHDARLKYTSNGKVYTNGGLTSNYLEGYLKYFDEVVVVTRREDVTEKLLGNYSLCNAKNIIFDGIKCRSTVDLVSRKTRLYIREKIKNTDFAIIRLPSFIGLQACKECELQNKPYVVEVVGNCFNALWNYGGLFKKICAPIVDKMTKRAIKKAENVIYVTSEYLQSEYPNHHNNVGISDVDITSVNKKKNIITKDKKVYKIGLIGSMNVKYKGHNIAVKTISLLKKEHINIEMHFLGDSTEHSRMKLYNIAKKYGVAENLYFDGMLPGGISVYKWIDDMDFIVSLSKTEGLPRSIIEAMSRGAVCVGTRAGGVPELLLDDCLIEHRNARSLARKIKMLVRNNRKMIEISNYNCELARKFCRSERDRQRTIFYKNILESIRKINVLNIVGGMNVGGVETMCMNVLRNINQQDFKMFYLCYSDKKYDYEEEVIDLGGAVLRMRNHGPIYNILTIKKIIQENDINIVHCHTYFNSMFGVLAAKISKSPVRIIVHSHSAQKEVRKISLFRRAYALLAKKIINRYSDSLVACGEEAARALFYNTDKILLIDNGIIVNNFKFSKRDRDNIRKQLGINKSTNVIGHVGRFAEVKNHNFILKVFSDYNKRNPNSVLVLVGDGDLMSTIVDKVKKNNLEDKVKFLGLRRDVNKLYNVMDVVLFPSFFEGVPVALVESQANGLPVLASDTIDKTVNFSGKIRFLSLKDKVAVWSNELEKLMGARYDGMDNALKSDYDISKVIGVLEQLYKKGLKV